MRERETEYANASFQAETLRFNKEDHEIKGGKKE